MRISDWSSDVCSSDLRDFTMAPVSKSRPSRVKVREHRERLRSQGLRPIQIWVPDVRAPSFRSEAHRQSLAVAAKIGRASCRERVCQYGVDLGGRRLIKKTRTINEQTNKNIQTT